MHLRILSLGAGVQSSTLALMIEKGIVPMVDCAIFSDTQAEPESVYEWLGWLEKQLSFPLYKVTSGSLTENLLKSNKGEYVRGSTIPLWTKSKLDGSLGILKRQCTVTYKIEPVTKKIRRLLGVQYKQKVPKGYKVKQLFGISKDEMQRMKISQTHYIDFQYPLIDLRLSRQDCLKWMAANNYPTPPRSACTYCPFHNNEEWKKVKNNPKEWQEVIELDKKLRSGLLGTRPDENEFFIHRSRQPLEEVNLDDEYNSGQLGFDFGMDEECEGMCGV
tara:strand:- start:41 stop:865 length:825 start_codon:yes stop_codon:yes gene_type:complete